VFSNTIGTQVHENEKYVTETMCIPIPSIEKALSAIETNVIGRLPNLDTVSTFMSVPIKVKIDV
jgi:hypothetical protein